MSQYDFGTIDPDATDGTELATLLDSYRTAANSNHRGASRPSYAVAGMHWIQTVSGTVEKIYYYDGANDLLLGTYNPTAHTFALDRSALPAADTTNAGAVILNDTTGVLTGTDTGKAVTAAALAALWADGGNVSAISSGIITLGDGGSFNLTSTGTVSKIVFATAKTGRRARIRFNTSRQLTNGANLALPGGANITTAVGDLAEIEDRGGGTGRINEYTRADGTPLVAPVSVPTAAIFAFPLTAVTGYLLCDGAAVSRTTYATLFALIGTTFGVGDGTTSFNVPDCRGRVIAGKDGGAGRLTNVATGGVDGSVIGNVGGEQAHQITVAELASHGHSEALASTASGSGPLSPGSTTKFNSGSTGSAGSDTAHNNVQPTIVLNWFIKT